MRVVQLNMPAKNIHDFHKRPWKIDEAEEILILSNEIQNIQGMMRFQSAITFIDGTPTRRHAICSESQLVDRCRVEYIGHNEQTLLVELTPLFGRQSEIQTRVIHLEAPQQDPI